jgi:acetyl esterase/lipase
MRTTWIGLLVLPSLAAAQGAPTFDDLVIGQAPLDAGGTVAVRMDLRIPAGASGRVPVVLWIHGGGWQSGDHNGVPGFVQPLLSSGIAIATVDYRVSSEAIFPAQIEDVKGAVRFLRANAATFGIDPARIGCWGSSAGGHLSALLATSGGVAGCEGSTGGNLDQPSTVLAAVDYFGPTAIVQMNPDVTDPPGSALDHDAPESPESRLIGFDGPGEGVGVLRANLANPNAPFPALAALVDLLNPITHVDANDPPLFVAHGELDTAVPRHQSVRLVDALVVANVEHVWRSVPTAGHGALGTATDAEAIAFLVLRLSDCDGNGLLDDADVANGAQDSDGDGLLDACETSGSAGTPMCFGDGAGAACPCGNTSPPGAAAGCRNSLGVGARLIAHGTASLAQDTLLLVGNGMPDSSALYFQGSTALDAGGIGQPFGDGLRCAGGLVVRLRTVTNAGGGSSHPGPGDLPVSVRGAIAAPGTRWYQVWYRNAVGFCTPATFNLSNAVRVDWSA